VDAYNPIWAIRAMLKYDGWLHTRIQATDTCNRWAFVLSAYNGGLGWVKRDKRLTEQDGKDPLLWWDNTELYSNRADWARKENRDYPRKIIYGLQPIYAQWGGGKLIC